VEILFGPDMWLGAYVEKELGRRMHVWDGECHVHAGIRPADIEATRAAQDQWVGHVNEIVSATLMTSANSWYMSANIPGKPRAFLPYLGPEGVGGYKKKCDEIAANGYEGFQLA